VSISVPSNRRTRPAWRAAVIAFVAVLAVGIGVAAGSFLLSARSTAVGAGAAYVPADAPFYIEVRLVPSGAQDAALRELLGRFPPIEGVDLAQPLYQQLAERLDELLVEEGADVSWTDDVAPWFDGHVVFALTELPPSAMELPTDPMAVPETPPVVVLLGVTDAALARDAIGRLIAAGDDSLTFTETQHQGVTIRNVEGTDSGAYAVTDDQVVIGTDADAVRAALDAHATGTGTVAETAQMTRLTDQLPADWLLFMTYDFSELMAQALSQAESQSPEIATAFGSLLEHQPLRGALGVSAAGDRLLLDSTTDAPTGPFAVENADRGLAAEVPADTLYYSEAGNLGATLAAVIEPLTQAVASMPGAEEQLRTAEAALGADLEELVSWIDDGAISIGYDGSQPFGGLVLVPNDIDAARRRLGQLGSFASLGAVDPTSGISVDERDVAGVTVTSIRWEDPNAGAESMMATPTGIVIEFAVTDDRALIGVGDAFISRVLALDEADTLASQPRYVDAVAELGGAENAGVAWMDIAGLRDTIESAFGPMLEMVDPAATYQSEIRPWLLPLDRFVSVVRLEGDVVVQRAALLVD
jgi:hypothetical protein